MTTLAFILVSVLLTQAAQTGVFAYLFLHDRRRHLGLWTASGGAGVLWQGVVLHREVAASPSVPDLVAGGLATVAVLLFVTGVLRFVRDRVPRLWWLGLGALGSWAAVATGLGLSRAVCGLPVTIFLCVTLIWGGLVCIRRAPAGAVGERVSGIAIIVWAAHMVHYPVTIGVEALLPWAFLLGSAVQALLTIGILILHFERTQREAVALQAELNRAAKMEALGRVTGGIAHEFNNFLTVVLSSTAMLEQSGGLRGAEARLVASAREAAERAASLTGRLLTFGRQSAIEPRTIDLNRLVVDTAVLIRPLLGEDIELTVDDAGRPVAVHADEGQLQQVLLNLALNARDAMAAGGALWIRLSIRREQEPTAVLEVADTGHGVADENRERLFEPFFTTKEIGAGSGLGLSVVYGIVTEAGGRIEVSSTTGAGTVFRVLLPAAPRADPTNRPPTARRDHEETVLFVEDDELLRGLGQAILEGAGFRVLVAAHGEQALALAAEHPGTIDLLVSDVVLPGLSGPNLARELARTYPDVAVLLVSGYPDRACGRDDGAFLAKPFSPDQLLARVEELLG